MKRQDNRKWYWKQRSIFRALKILYLTVKVFKRKGMDRRTEKERASRSRGVRIVERTHRVKGK